MAGDGAGARRQAQGRPLLANGEIKSTPEGTVVNAVKDGKEVRLLVDGTGQIREQ
jgi:hypothetical protein